MKIKMLLTEVVLLFGVSLSLRRLFGVVVLAVMMTMLLTKYFMYNVRHAPR